jgi:hypothetical protein
LPSSHGLTATNQPLDLRRRRDLHRGRDGCHRVFVFLDGEDRAARQVGCCSLAGGNVVAQRLVGSVGSDKLGGGRRRDGQHRGEVLVRTEGRAQ